MRIGMISQWYEPETGSAAHPTAIARALHARGHEVKVLTGFPSYPLGRTYDGWRMRPRHHELRDGIQVMRVPDLPSHDNSAARRALSLTSFAVSAALQVRWLKDVDVCLTYLTPATVGGAARVLRRLWGVPYVLYVQDLWPESVTASGFIGRPQLERRAEQGINAYLAGLYARASAVAAISPTMSRTLAERGAGDRAHVVYNWINEDVFSPSEPSTELPRDRVWIMYAGGIGEVQGLDAAVKAMDLLRDRDDIGLALVGDGVALSGLRELADRLGVADRIRFLGHREMAAMSGLMAEAAAQLISLRDLPLFRGTVPSKLQAAMACGQPLVCAVNGDAADLVCRSGTGFTATPEDSASIAGAFRAMADSGPAARAAMGERALAFYRGEFSAEIGAARLETHLAAAMAEGPRR